MPDLGLVSGFISVAIDNTIQQILDSISNGVRCSDELASLKDLVMKIKPIIRDIQQHRREFNSKGDGSALSVNDWLKKLENLLRQASTTVQQCTIPTWNVLSCYQTSTRISRLISNINEHLDFSSLLHIHQIHGGQMTETMEADMDSASSSHGFHAQVGTAMTKLIDEPLIVGQDKATADLYKLIMEDPEARNIGVLGKGGSGKTLLLKTVFNSKKVRSQFTEGLLLWITVSQSPSVTNLRNDLYTQITLQKNVDSSKITTEEDVKLWLNETLEKSKRFALFVDDVWESEAAELLEGLGILRPVTMHSDSKLVISSRYRSALLKMGVADKYTITMGDLIEDDSWRLFAFHAFPYNKRNPPANIDAEKAKIVCDKCGGLPLALKVLGRAMAGSTDPHQWEWAAQSPPNTDSVYDSLRLSYDALGRENVNLQLCFLYSAATFLEDKIISVYEMIQRWVGEALLPMIKLPQGRLQLGYDPFEMGKTYLNLLADRCLIEPIMRGVDGQVEYFRVHDVLRDMGTKIAEEEEKFYCRVDCNLTTLKEKECLGYTRIFLSDNQLTSLPDSWRAPQVCSLLLPGNVYLTKVPSMVMKSMMSLKFLDLSGTGVQSLPESVGDLEQLVCLALIAMPQLKKLPRSVSKLARLEILDVSFSSVITLPSSIHKLRSLRYLDITCCREMQYLPSSISRLTSLQYLLMYGCTTLWKRDEQKRYKGAARINDIAPLHELKMLSFTNNGDILSEGTLMSMTKMDTMQITLTEMERLPHDITNMTKLRRLVLECSLLVNLDNSFCNFQNMSNLELSDCCMLEKLPHLHKLRSLRQLRIVRCPKLKRFPNEFGEMGAFPSLEIYSLVELNQLEELPVVEEGAMASLQIFTVMECPALRPLPYSYLDLKTVKKLRIYGCPMAAENLNGVKRANTMVKVMSMSPEDTAEVKKRYLQVKAQMTGWLYGEFWCDELFLFLKSLEAF